MGLVKVTPKKDVIHAIEFTGKNKEDVRKAVSEFATVREEENDAIALTRKGADTGKIMYPGQVLVITGTTTQVYSKARFEAEFEVEAKPKAPKKPAAPKAPKKPAAPKEPKAPVPLTPAEEALYGPTPVEATAEELAEMTKAAEEPKAPKKPSAPKEPGKVEAAAAKIAEEAEVVENADAK